MRSVGWVLGVAFLSSPAFADDDATVKTAMASQSATMIEPLLAASVKIGPLLFKDPACQKQFGGQSSVTGADRRKLATCLAGMNVGMVPGHSTAFFDSVSGTLFEVTVVDHKIATIGPFDVRPGEADLPTVYQMISALELRPSKATRAAMDKAKDKPVHVLAKACIAKPKAKVTARMVTGSGIAAFDKEAIAYLAKSPMAASDIEFDGHAIIGCTVWHVGAAPMVRDIVQPVKIEKQDPNGVEGGEEGVVGGLEGDYPPPPPPPPPPPAPPQNVPPSVLEGNRIAGTKLIAPDDATKKQIAADGKSKLVGSYKMCVALDGSVTVVTRLKSTGYPAYDNQLYVAMRQWKFKPYLVNGRATPVCTAETFIFSP